MADSIEMLNEINAFGKNTLIDHLGIEVTEISEKSIKGKMPVDHRTVQPFGLLHGGASVVLAETLGSYGSHVYIKNKPFNAVGLAINANHIKSVSRGFVYGHAKMIHAGKTTHIWEINITNENNDLVCVSRLTMAIIPRKNTNL
jgi:1,4-dihydroxy-2-naphthoyl-CoA hydrolase